MKKEKIIIIGGKGAAVATGELIAESHKKYNAPYDFLGYCIDDPSLGTEINGNPILCKRYNIMEKYGKYDDVKFIFSLYKPNCMEDRVKLLQDMNIPLSKFTNFIHPTTYIAPSAKIGTGNIFSSNVIINNNVMLGNFNAFYSNVVVEHDTIIGDYNYFAASAVIGSEIMIGNGNFFGLHSTIREHISIENYNIIGMQAGVIDNIGSHKTVVGLPAHEL